MHQIRKKPTVRETNELAVRLEYDTGASELGNHVEALRFTRTTAGLNIARCADYEVARCTKTAVVPATE